MTVTVMSYACGMINDSKNPCFVRGFSEVPKSVGTKEFVFAMKMTRGWKKGVPTYLCSVCVVEDFIEVKAKPSGRTRVLYLVEYEDVMTNELPKGLSTRKVFDYNIEIVLISKPTTKLVQLN